MHLGDGATQPPTFGYTAEERATFDPQRFYTGFKLHLGRPDTGRDAFLMTKYFLTYVRRRVAPGGPGPVDQHVTPAGDQEVAGMEVAVAQPVAAGKPLQEPQPGRLLRVVHEREERRRRREGGDDRGAQQGQPDAHESAQPRAAMHARRFLELGAQLHHGAGEETRGDRQAALVHGLEVVLERQRRGDFRGEQVVTATNGHGGLVWQGVELRIATPQCCVDVGTGTEVVADDLLASREVAKVLEKHASEVLDLGFGRCRT